MRPLLSRLRTGLVALVLSGALLVTYRGAAVGPSAGLLSAGAAHSTRTAAPGVEFASAISQHTAMIDGASSSGRRALPSSESAASGHTNGSLKVLEPVEEFAFVSRTQVPGSASATITLSTPSGVVLTVNTTLVGACRFQSCPAGQPHVYYMTSHRNRGDSLNRLLRSVVADVQSEVNVVPGGCVCLAVADFNDVVIGVPVTVAVEDWPYVLHADTIASGMCTNAHHDALRVRRRGLQWMLSTPHII
jgi:hypothetical protein